MRFASAFMSAADATGRPIVEKLDAMEFPKTEMQIYGNTIIIYTTYLYEIEAQGKRSTTTGRGTEIFVRRNNLYVNTGWHLDQVK